MSVTGGTVAVSLAWVGAWVVGDQVRQRRRRLADLVERGRRPRRLTTIEDIARETIGEIDQLVRALREDDGGGEARDAIELRIVQGALTNAARHGGGHAEIEIAYGESQLELTVSNPTEPDSNGDTLEGGHGILGMRERAALLGGSFDARRSDGRFHVHARLPYAAAEQQ